MPISRQDLKKRFNPTNNAVPTGTDYAVLVNSILNLRDDRFYGVWNSNSAYFNRGVVFYETAFYVLENVKEDEPFCSPTKPKDDPQHWRKVQDSLVDEDWNLSEDKHSLAANALVQYVGIGTQTPQSMLDVKSEQKGQIKLQPNLSDPRLQIVNLDPDCKQDMLDLRVTSKNADLTTDAPQGFRLIKNNPTALEKVKTVAVLNIDATKMGAPRVGIGTETPTAHFEVCEPNVGNVRIDGGETVKVEGVDQKGDPSVKITKPNKSHLRLMVNDTEAIIQTKAENGLHIKKTLKNGSSATLAVVSNNGNVGIGTRHPKARLHIQTPDTRDGIVKLGFCNTYPVLQLINDVVPFGGGNYRNSFSIGTTMDAAVLKTDSEGGFEFKKTVKLPTDADVIADLNEGETLVRILSKGALTVGSGLTDSPYQLEVDGATNATSSYLRADRNAVNSHHCKPLESVLAKVCDLKPVRFQWKNPPLTAKTQKWELGFLSDDMKTQFDEVVFEKSIAYQNLVPVLVKAIQEQQAHIHRLEEKYAKLEQRLDKLEGKNDYE